MMIFQMKILPSVGAKQVDVGFAPLLQ
jgi:hypothetical protein